MYDTKEVLDYYKNKNRKWCELWSSYVSKFTWTDTLVSYYYKEARQVYNIPVDFDAFRSHMLEERHRWNYRKIVRKRRRQGLYTSEYYYREKRGYKKKAEHKKKELSLHEINKREWKKKKKDPRDQKYKGYGKHRTNAIKTGNRAERRHTKKKLKSGDWHGEQLKWWTHDGDERAWECHWIASDWEDYQDKPKRCWVDPWDWS